MKVQVGIIMGSKSDARIMKDAGLALKEFGVKFEMKIVSAHRTPEYMVEYAQEAHSRGVRVLIAGAGGAAHLPGMVASLTTLPVIGVPVSINKLNGLDSLLSIAQMPKGVPVASVAIDNAYNAGLLAIRILAAQGNESLNKALQRYQNRMRRNVLKSQRSLNQRNLKKLLS